MDPSKAGEGGGSELRVPAPVRTNAECLEVYFRQARLEFRLYWLEANVHLSYQIHTSTLKRNKNRKERLLVSVSLPKLSGSLAHKPTPLHQYTNSLDNTTKHKTLRLFSLNRKEFHDKVIELHVSQFGVMRPSFWQGNIIEVR